MIVVVEPSFEILTNTDGMLEHIERCGRTCYKSEDRISPGSAERFVRSICKNHHESVLEHGVVGVQIICSRAASHQLVRHRLVSYSQESQRYCNYTKGKFGAGLQVICPASIGLLPGEYIHEPYPNYGHPRWYYRKPLDNGLLAAGEPVDSRGCGWLETINVAYLEYEAEVHVGVKPEDARYVLPNATKTELAVTMNLRMWRHVFKERCHPNAQWEIRGIMSGLLFELGNRIPVVFDDLIELVNQRKVENQ